MRLGLMLGEQPASTPAPAHLDSLLRQLEAGQRNGFRHFVIGQHFVVPDGGRWLQPVPLLARLSAEVDPDVRLVTWILILALYPPVLLAEELATLDIVSEGRIAVGVGVGYRPEEYAALGVPFEERNARFEEGIEILRAMWSNDRVSYQGTFTTLRDVQVHIRPVQQAGPSIWIGAQTPAGIRRAARLGDAWAISPTASLDVLRRRFAIFAQARAAAGKDLGPQPFRQEVVLGRDRAEAEAEVRARTAEHYGRVAGGPGSGHAADSGFIAGPAEDCAAQLRAIAQEFPVDPIIPRAQWPSMSTDDAVAYIDQLGRELVPLLADHTPAPTFRAGAAQG